MAFAITLIDRGAAPNGGYLKPSRLRRT